MPPGGRPQPPAAKAPVVQEAGAEDKTSAINLADFGLAGEDESTVSVDANTIRAKAAARSAPAPEDSEKTTAFRVDDLPPEDDATARGPQKTLLGHPVPRPGAAVRGGAPPVKRQETLAIAPAGRQAAAAVPQDEDQDKTSALSLDDVERIDAAPAPAKPAPRPAAPAPAPARPAPKPAPAPVPQYEDQDKTSALSLDDIDKIDALPARSAAPVAKPLPKAAPAPAAEENEKTTAFSLDDLDQIDSAPPPKKPAAVAAKKQIIEESEKTMAVPLDDAIAAIDAAPPARAQQAKRAAAAAQAAQALEDDDAPPPARRSAAAPAQKRASAGKGGGGGAAAALASFDAAGGFLGNIGYFLTYEGNKAKMDAGLAPQQELDEGARAAGMRNFIILTGAIGALMLVFGIIR
ncbi:MAG: hypothetical protein U1F43_25495 [Myxococcota bacterium]